MKSRRNFPPNLEADIKFASCPTVMLLLVVLRYVSSSKACVWLIIKSEFKEMDYTSPFRATVSTKQPRYLCYWCCGSVAKLYPILCNPWTIAHQASPSSTISQSFLRLMFIELVMPSNHLILCCPLLLLPSIRYLYPVKLIFKTEISVFLCSFFSFISS